MGCFHRAPPLIALVLPTKNRRPFYAAKATSSNATGANVVIGGMPSLSVMKYFDVTEYTWLSLYEWCLSIVFIGGTLWEGRFKSCIRLLSYACPLWVQRCLAPVARLAIVGVLFIFLMLISVFVWSTNCFNKVTATSASIIRTYWNCVLPWICPGGSYAIMPPTITAYNGAALIALNSEEYIAMYVITSVEC